MESLSFESRDLLEHNKIVVDEDAPDLLVDHIFKSLRALRELKQCGLSTCHSDLALSSLISEASSVAREMTYSIKERPDIICPAHGAMELIIFGSDRHAFLLDNIYKIRSQKKNVSCRQCERTSLAHDLKFFYCSDCHYTRCTFCTPSQELPWDLISSLIDACPNVCGKLFPGGRTLLHEISPRQHAKGVIETYLKIYKSAAMIADNGGELPLHWATACGAGVEVTTQLLSAYPESARLTTLESKLPLHMAVHSRNADVVRCLLEWYPEACDQPDSLGWVPLHYAVNSLPEPVPDIFDMCLNAFPGGCEQPNHQGYFPLHLYIRNHASPAPWVIRRLVATFPFAAFVTTGEDDELPLHVLAGRSPPCPECVRILMEVNPDGALQRSKETSWANAVTPIDIATNAVKRAEVNAGADVSSAVEPYWEVVRTMLLANRRHDPELLKECLYKIRRPALLISLAKYNSKYPRVAINDSSLSSSKVKYGEDIIEEEVKMESISLLDAVGMTTGVEGNKPSNQDIFDSLGELYGTSRVAWKNIIQFI